MNEPEPDFLSEKEIELLKRTILKPFTPDDQEFFIRLCVRQKIDPFRKPPLVYPTLRGGQLLPITSIGYLTAQAILTGEYRGCQIYWANGNGEWLEAWLDDGQHPLAAKAVVKRKDWDHPEVAIARWKAYSAQGPFWARMDDLMLAKCAKALAIRGAFPDAISGMYIPEELQSGEFNEVLMDQQKVADAQKHDDDLKKQGVKFVAHKPEKRVSPTEALEPPEEPPFERTLKEEVRTEEPARFDFRRGPEDVDDLDMSPRAPGPKTAPENLWWKDYVLKSMNPKSVDYYRKKVGDLTGLQLEKVKEIWIPNILNPKDKDGKPQIASQEQLDDLKAFQARIEYDAQLNPLS